MLGLSGTIIFIAIPLYLLYIYLTKRNARLRQEEHARHVRPEDDEVLFYYLLYYLSFLFLFY